MKNKATRRLEAARLEAMVDAAWKDSADDGKSPESQDALEQAKINAVLASVESKEGRFSSWFQEYWTDILLHGTIVSLIGMGIISGMGTFQVQAQKNQLQQDLLEIGQEYNAWDMQTLDATDEDKEKFILESVGKNFDDPEKIGVAVSYSESNDTICVWEKGLQESNIHQAMSFSVTDGSSNLKASTNCSSMEVLFSPDGEHLAQNPDNKIPEGSSEPNSSDATSEDSHLPELLGASGVVIGLTVGSIIAAKKLRAGSRRKKNFTEKWEALMSRHDAVRKEWALYELDPMKMLEYPVLTDMREQVTIDLHAALRKANNLRPVNAKAMSLEDADDSKYEKAVDALETAFHVAESEAKRVQWTKFSADEQKRLNTAKTLLNFVLDGTANEFERQAAYKRLQKEITGLINIPKPTIHVIEEQLRKMISA